MAFVPLQAPKVNPTAATDQGAGGKKEDKARQHTDPSPIIFSPPTRRPARKGNRGVGAKPIEDVPPSRVLLGCPPVPMLPSSRDGLGNRAQTGQWRGVGSAAVVVGSVHPGLALRAWDRPGQQGS